MPPKEKSKNQRVKEEAKKFEESSESSKIPSSSNTTLPLPPKIGNNSFQWGSHITQVAQKSTLSPTPGFQFPPSQPTSQPAPAKTEEEKSITQLLMEMKTENQVTALNHQNEFIGLKNLMVAQEVSLGQKIT